MQLTGERYYLWRGCCQGVWAEGPHIYKKGGYYYLLISEGGTSFEHAMSVAISKDITGPYWNNPRNPVLTHRQLSYDTPITGVGHADIVELADGRWYAVALAWRLVDGRHGILGRETFLVPMTWETEPYTWKDEKLTFPVFSPDTGRVELRFPLPFGDSPQEESRGLVDDFDEPTLGLEWNFRRAPARKFHSLTANGGTLRLDLQPGSIAERAQYSFVGVRQRHFQFEATTQMTFTPALGEQAGITVIQNDKSALLLSLTNEGGTNRLALTQNLYDEVGLLAAAEFRGDTVSLRVSGDYLNYTFSYSADGETWQKLGDVVDGTALSPYDLGGYNYTGVYIGLYASSNGRPSDNHADYEYFSYKPTGASRDDWYHRQVARQRDD